MADNIDDKLLKNTPNNPSENPEGEIITNKEIEIVNLNQQTEKMEVHAQELHKAPGHGWKHYFFEFFMLFLAVTLGFFVENIREHYVEEQREKQYIRSLISDLKSDQIVISQHISGVKAGLSMMDSMINLLNSPSQISNNTGQLYYWARLAPRLYPLSLNNRTFEQLKNSGNFRLIRQMSTSDKIMAYYELLALEQLLQSINETEFTEYKKVAAKVFSPAVFLEMEGPNQEVKRTNENPPLRSNDKELLQELSVFSVYMHGTKNGVLGNEEKLKTVGAELINYLQKEYHME